MQVIPRKLDVRCRMLFSHYFEKKEGEFWLRNRLKSVEAVKEKEFVDWVEKSLDKSNRNRFAFIILGTDPVLNYQSITDNEFLKELD